MADQIQILRGTRDEIVKAQTKLLEGQPLYNETDKYLTIGSSAGLLPKEQSPIKVREIGGYVEDNEGTLSSSPTEANRYYVGPANNTADPTLLMHGTNLEITAKGTGAGEGLLSVEGKDVNITGTNTLNVTSSGSIQLSASDLNISGLGFEVHSTDTNDGSTVIKMGTNTGIGGNYVEIGYTGATGSTSVYNISIDTNFDTDQIYTAPAGTPKIDAVGATGTTYAENSAEKRLAPIIYNIGQRLDSLGFNEADAYTGGGSRLHFSKIGYFIIVTLAAGVLNESSTLTVPEGFRRKNTQKKLTQVSASGGGNPQNNFYVYYNADHTISCSRTQSETGVILTIQLRPGTTFGYDMRY